MTAESEVATPCRIYPKPRPNLLAPPSERLQPICSLSPALVAGYSVRQHHWELMPVRLASECGGGTNDKPDRLGVGARSSSWTGRQVVHEQGMGVNREPKGCIPLDAACRRQSSGRSHSLA